MKRLTCENQVSGRAFHTSPPHPRLDPLGSVPHGSQPSQSLRPHVRMDSNVWEEYGH